MRRIRILLTALAVAISAISAPAGASAAAAPPHGVNVVSSSSYVDSAGATHVVGEVVNNTRLPTRFVRITVDFHDAADVLVGTGFTYALLDILDPGEKSGFHAVEEVAGADSYALRVTYSVATRPANHNFAIEATGSTIDEIGYTHLIGTATNLNTTAADFVSIHATFYDAAGTVVGTDFTYVNTDDTSLLRPGETASFELIFFAPVFATYVLVGDSGNAPSLPLTLLAAPASPVYGTPVTLSGMASPGAAVTIQRWDLAAGWVMLARTTANDAGSYSVSARITTTWFIRALTSAGPSVPLTRFQKALISLRSNLSTVPKGSAITLSGIVRPLYPGKKVAIQQFRNGAWKTVAYATLNSASAFSHVWASRTTGTFLFRALIAAQADSTSNVSLTRRIVVR